MKKYFTVKEVTSLLGYKNEETIKRKIKDGMFPGAIQNSRKEGWRIPASDVAALKGSPKKASMSKSTPTSTNYNKSELIKWAFQIANLESPSEELHKVLTSLPLERALEICLIMRQQSRPIDDYFKFFKAAQSKKWKPDPITIEKKKSLVDLTQRDYEEMGLDEQQTGKVSLYNWLEQD
ncbi:helix-turn-helix transcriptional regulator [Bacillus paramycoides]|uniref:helix-turn-helix transcriptional regulator n=1 Tax=Bacillus paramycoides TaxID=2026194 RepID=UPI003D009CA9